MAGRRRILRRAGLVVRSILDGLRRHQRNPTRRDLSPAGGFNGLSPGDHWCLCAARWTEALTAGAAPRSCWKRPMPAPWSGQTSATSRPTASAATQSDPNAANILRCVLCAAARQ